MGLNDALAVANPSTALDCDPQVALGVYLAKPGYEKYARFLFAALSAIPWVWSLIGRRPRCTPKRSRGA